MLGVAMVNSRLRIGGVSLAYTEWPGSPPPILALHGLSTSRGLLPTFLPEANQRFAYDARGHGESDHVLGGYRLEDFTADAVHFLTDVVAQPAIVVGHSLGGMTAICVAAQRPELVSALVLLDPTLYVGERGLRDDLQPFTNTFKNAGRPQEDLVKENIPPGRARQVSSLDPEAMAMCLDGSMFRGCDVDALLAAVRCPVVLQHGERELGSMIYPGELERAVSHIDNCMVMNIVGSGHTAWLVKPEEFRAAVGEAIAQLSKHG